MELAVHNVYFPNLPHIFDCSKYFISSRATFLTSLEGLCCLLLAIETFFIRKFLFDVYTIEA